MKATNRHGRAILLLLWLGILGIRPAAGTPQQTFPGRVFVSGDGNLFYHRGTSMLGPLGVFVVLFAALVDDDEEGSTADLEIDPYDCGYYEPRYQPHLWLEAYQLGSSTGVFLTPHLAVGLRVVAQGNGYQDSVRSFWGGGPELAWYPGNAWRPLRPFISLSTLYTHARTDALPTAPVLTGPSYQLRAGLNWFGEHGGIYVQAERQSRGLDLGGDMIHTRSGWGAGMGITFFLD